MIQTSLNNIFRTMDVQVTTMKFTKAGDKLSTPLTTIGVLSTNYRRRHIVISGNFEQCGYDAYRGLRSKPYTSNEIKEQNNSDLVIFPSIEYDDLFEAKNATSMEVTALEDNSSFLCVSTFSDDKNKAIKHEIIDVKKDIPAKLLKDSVYVTEVELNTNYKMLKTFTPIAVVTDDKVVIPTKDGKIARFYSVNL